jgi:alanyl-tRNA synthetase
MALFGEKYGEIVRMVEVGDGDFSRELCGGTHVRSTAEVGAFVVTHETSSAANVRRIEALTGPEAVARLRRHDALLVRAADLLRTQPDAVPDAVVDLQAERKQLEKAARSGGSAELDMGPVMERAQAVGDAKILVEEVPAPDMDALLRAVDRVKDRLGDAAIVFGARTNGKSQFVASVSPALVSRGLRAGDIVKVAAAVTGGGGGGRDTLARAGGRDPEKLPEALAAAREAIEKALA